jgi:sporulation protein YlmC with PRC-barrel domain
MTGPTSSRPAGDPDFRIGARVRCTDGECGQVTELVVDPAACTVTHLVVEPAHRSGLGRLVPLDLVEAVTDEIRLRCTMAGFSKLAHAEETRLVPGSNGGYGGYGLGQAVTGPYFGMSSFGVAGGGIGDAFDPVVHDTLPSGEVAVRRGEGVHATDADIGRIQGLVIDRRDHRVTHVLLQEGHLWGRRQVAIPVDAVTSVADGIRLNLTKQQVEDLPPVDVDDPR